MECSPHRAGHDLWSRRKADTAVKLTLQELAYRGLAARFCRSCSNPSLKTKHAMPDKTTGLLHILLSYADFQGASYSGAHPAFVLPLIFQPMASSRILQISFRGTVQNQISIAQWTVCLPVDIPTGWEPQRNLVVRALRVAFADFSAAPWQGFEKSERGPNNSSLFQPLAAVIVVAVQVLLSVVTAKEKLPCKTKKTVDSLPPGRHSYRLETAG